MDSDSLGETSKKKSSDIGENKPFKKARYLWQVKGKYHLKETDKNKRTELSKEEIVLNEEASDKLLTNSDKLDKFEEIPVTLVKPNLKNEDYYLHKWQARQIAKGFVDNTINRVLESWMVAPFDANDFVENCDHDGQVEDEGILMAIQSHGLQSGFPNPIFYNHNQATEKQNATSTDIDLSVQYYEKFCVLKDDSSADSASLENDSLKMNDTDFLDAAVAVAIQKKGLTSYKYVDCG